MKCVHDGMSLRDTAQALGVKAALHRNALRILLLSALSAALVLLNIAKPVVFSRIIDFGLIEGDWEYILRQCSWFVAIAAGVFLGSLGASYLSSCISNTTVFTIREALLKRMFSTDYQLFVDKNTGDITTRVDGDVGNIRDYLLSVLNTATGSFLGFVSAMVYIGAVQWKIILVGFLTTPLVALSLFLFRKLLYRLSDRQRQLQSTVNDGVYQGIDKQSELRSLGLAQYFLARVMDSYADLRQNSIRNDTTRALNSNIIQLLDAAGYIVTIGYGSWLVLGDELSVGHLLAFLTLRRRFLSPVEFVSEIYRGFFITKSSFERITEFLHYPTLQSKGLMAGRGGATERLELEMLTFGYDDAKQIAASMSVSFEQGWTRIHGANGVGKTTLVHLILGVLTPASGQVRFWGNGDMPGEWPDLFSYTSQKCFLFRGSLRENIRILNPSLTDAEMVRELRAIGFTTGEHDSDSVDLDLVVAEDGKNLSAGQRQKIALGRSILKDARVYVFDESLSNIDAPSKVRILRHLRARLRGRIVIWISHEDHVDFLDAEYTLREGRLLAGAQEYAAPALAVEKA